MTVVPASVLEIVVETVLGDVDAEDVDTGDEVVTTVLGVEEEVCACVVLVLAAVVVVVVTSLIVNAAYGQIGRFVTEQGFAEIELSHTPDSQL